MKNLDLLNHKTMTDLATKGGVFVNTTLNDSKSTHAIILDYKGRTDKTILDNRDFSFTSIDDIKTMKRKGFIKTFINDGTFNLIIDNRILNDSFFKLVDVDSDYTNIY